MYKISQNTLKKAHKPFDVVTDTEGNVGYIQEVSVNDCQPDPRNQIHYSVIWLVGDQNKSAWWDHEELTVHTNLLYEFALAQAHPFGNGKKFIKNILFNIYE